MKTMGISKFKSHALKILDQVAKTQEIRVNCNAEMYDELLLSAISPWEFSKLLEKRK